MYRALFFDVWGCLHNGISPYPQAIKALTRFIERGGIVVLLTNSPRPNASTIRQIDAMGVPRSAWSIMVTSGDAARATLFSGRVGHQVLHIGTEHELSFFQPNEEFEDLKQRINRVSLEEAEGIVCTGPFRGLSRSTDGYVDLLAQAKKLKLPMLCANPDIFVDRGAQREICAGAIAQKYASIGGEVLLFGKPRPAIYDLAKARLEQLIPGITNTEILCVGDGIETDIRGAIGYGLKSLFVTGGLATIETGTRDQPDPNKLQQYLAAMNMDPDYSTGLFR